MDPVKKILPISDKKGVLDEQAEQVKKPARQRTTEEIVKDIL